MQKLLKKNIHYQDMKIYFKGGEKAKTLKELFSIGFCVDGGYTHFDYKYIYKFKPTYKNKSLSNLECKEAYRSFPDLYKIAQTYFPDASKEEVAYIILNKIDYMYCIYCNDIQKFVFLVYITLLESKKFRRPNNYLIRDIDSTGLSFSNILALSNKHKKLLQHNK